MDYNVTTWRTLFSKFQFRIPFVHCQDVRPHATTRTRTNFHEILLKSVEETSVVKSKKNMAQFT